MDPPLHLARARAQATGLPKPRFAPPLKFVGRLTKESADAERDWQGLRAVLAQAYGPDVARRVNATLGRENDSSPQKQFYHRALATCDKARPVTNLRSTVSIAPYTRNPSRRTDCRT
jgi:hypothetical protein